jgi:heptosyltransferase-2/heptosyltransferase-3
MGENVLKDNPFIDEHICYDPSKGVWDAIRTILKIRRKKYDLVIDFMNNPRSALFALLSGAKKRVAFESKRRFFYTDRVAKIKNPDYIVREKFLLLKACGFDPKGEDLILKHTACDRSRDKPRIILSPTHKKAQSRRWPLKNFAWLADELARKYGAEIIWLWSPDEPLVNDEVVSMCKEKTTKGPENTSFSDMTDLIASADLFVGNANGPCHVANAVDVSVVQLHGPGCALSWSPMTGKNIALQKPSKNIEDISREEVLMCCEKMLSLI